MNRRMLFVTMDFPPSRAIGAHACEQIARHLTLHGWDPIVLTLPAKQIEFADPHYARPFPGKVVTARQFPHPLHIYRRLKSILRRSGGGSGTDQTRARQGSEDGIRNWVLSLLAAPDIYTGWILPATLAGLRAIRRERITHIFSSAPFWTNHLIGLLLARLTGLPWIVHYRDPWNQVPQAKPVTSLSARIERWLEALVIRRADAVVCVTEGHTSLLRQEFPDVPAEKFFTIPNGFDEAEWDGSAGPAVQPERSDPDRFTVTYTGGFRLGSRTPRPLFRAIRRLIDAGEVDSGAVRVELYGDCDVAEGMPVRQMARDHGLGDVVHVLPPISRPETLRRMSGADLLLLLAEGWTLQIPGKTYEYLRAGRPILALTTGGALADLLAATGGAWVCDPADDDAIAAAVREAHAAWKRGSSARTADRAIVAGFDRRQLAGRYAALLDCARPNTKKDTLRLSHVRN